MKFNSDPEHCSVARLSLSPPTPVVASAEHSKKLQRVTPSRILTSTKMTRYVWYVQHQAPLTIQELAITFALDGSTNSEAIAGGQRRLCRNGNFWYVHWPGAYLKQ